jgi:serine protease AprX
MTNLRGWFRQFTVLTLATLLLGLLFSQALSAAPPGAPNRTWQSKVDPWVLEQAARGETEFILMLDQQADLSHAVRLTRKADKGHYVYQQLHQTALHSQASLLEALRCEKIKHQSFWVANMVWVRGSLEQLSALAMRSDVARVYANPSVALDRLPTDSHMILTPAESTGVYWNIAKINAPSLWEQGFNGQGAVVGGQDTGYDWEHIALINQYRGWDGFTEDHDYAWHDAIHQNDPHTSPGNPCGFDSPIPCDDDSHGTHTMGTMVGDNPTGDKIGVAPGAKWIGCRNMEQGYGTPATYAECYQWFIAPTRVDGSDPRPDLAPDVINNSWSCPTYEGCTEPDVLLAVVDNVRAAGILTAHSAGNSGPTCGTVNRPAAIYASSFTVGATASNDVIASFSSRGPVSVDGSYRLKPDVSAPGLSIYSSIPNGGYDYKSGTSMAAPHVAGLAALLISANPALSGQVDALEALIERSAVPLTDSVTCGGVPGSNIPNNTYGWGRVDAWNAFQGHLLDLEVSVSHYYRPYNSPITYTLTIEHIAVITPVTSLSVTDTLPLHTSFITATSPYNLINGTVHWTLPDLNPMESSTQRLVVRTPLSGTTMIQNLYFGASANPTATLICSQGITTTIGFIDFLPYFFAEGP